MAYELDGYEKDVISYRVAMGARCLTTVLGDSWVQSITRPVDVGDTLECPLGQVYGMYFDAPEFIRAASHQFGFSVAPATLSTPTTPEEYDVLNRFISSAWEREITQLREGK